MKVLFAYGIFRSAKKTFSVVFELAKHCDVEVLCYNQMSPTSIWSGDHDLRILFINKCKKAGIKIIYGPDQIELQNKINDPSLFKSVDFSQYKIVFVDDNLCKSSWGTNNLCITAKKHGCVTIGSPHGNSEFKRYNFADRLKDVFDYSFVFGEFEKSQMKVKPNQIDRLLTGGIPENDDLKNSKSTNEYILIITNMLKNNCNPKTQGGYHLFTEKMFNLLKMLEISKKYNKKILIKEKSRSVGGDKKVEYSLKHLERHENVRVIMDIEDEQELFNSCFLTISAPSTMCFRSIQMGIPTVLLKGFGAVGNFENYKGTINVGDDLESKIEQLINDGRDEQFLDSVLTGGKDFNSTQIYVNSLLNIGKK